MQHGWHAACQSLERASTMTLMAIPFFVVGIFILIGGIIFIGVVFAIVQAFRNGSGVPPRRTTGMDDTNGGIIPPVIPLDDSFTNPANPLYHIHHPSGGDITGGHTSPSPSFDSSPSPSFDSGASSSPSFDSGSSPSGGCDTGGSNCG